MKFLEQQNVIDFSLKPNTCVTSSYDNNSMILCSKDVIDSPLQYQSGSSSSRETTNRENKKLFSISQLLRSSDNPLLSQTVNQKLPFLRNSREQTLLHSSDIENSQKNSPQQSQTPNSRYWAEFIKTNTKQDTSDATVGLNSFLFPHSNLRYHSNTSKHQNNNQHGSLSPRFYKIKTFNKRSERTIPRNSLEHLLERMKKQEREKEEKKIRKRMFKINETNRYESGDLSFKFMHRIPQLEINGSLNNSNNNIHEHKNLQENQIGKSEKLKKKEKENESKTFSHKQVEGNNFSLESECINYNIQINQRIRKTYQSYSNYRNQNQSHQQQQQQIQQQQLLSQQQQQQSQQQKQQLVQQQQKQQEQQQELDQQQIMNSQQKQQHLKINQVIHTSLTPTSQTGSVEKHKKKIISLKMRVKQQEDEQQQQQQNPIVFRSTDNSLFSHSLRSKYSTKWIDCENTFNKIHF